MSIAFSPYTYNMENVRETKRVVYGKKNEIISMILMLFPFMFIYYYTKRVRVGRAKTEFYLNQMMKRKFIADELNLKPRKMRLQELKQIIRD